MLSELKPPKWARNTPQNWVDKRKERERAIRTGLALLRGKLLKRKGTHTLGSHLIDGEINQGRGDLNVTKKSAAGGLSLKKIHAPVHSLQHYSQ